MRENGGQYIHLIGYIKGQEADARVGMFQIVKLQRELSSLLNCKVHLVTHEAIQMLNSPQSPVALCRRTSRSGEA